MCLLNLVVEVRMTPGEGGRGCGRRSDICREQRGHGRDLSQSLVVSACSMNGLSNSGVDIGNLLNVEESGQKGRMEWSRMAEDSPASGGLT